MFEKDLDLFIKSSSKKKKGFTIVELVIVIAVIAILAAVLVPTFSNVVENANASSDKSLVRNINNVLEIKGSLNQLPNDKTELKKVLKEYGINETKNKANNHIIFWSKSQNMFFIWGIKEQEIIFPEYCRGMNLDDFDDEVNMSVNDYTNLIYNTKQIEIPHTGIIAYCKEPKDGWGLYGDGKRIKQAGNFVTVGLIEIDVLSYDSLTVYIKGAVIRSTIRDSYFRMHIFKDSDYNNVTEINNLYIGLTNDYWGFEVSEIAELYFKITFDMDKLIEAATNSEGKIEKVNYALSLYGKSSNLIITHNEIINN